MHDQTVFLLHTLENGKKILKKQGIDRRIKRGWIKFISDDMKIPLPTAVEYANQIPGKPIFADKFELAYGEIVIEGYEISEFKGRNGKIVHPWVYRIFGVDNNGNVFEFDKGWQDLKKQMREQGLNKELLEGSGKLAAIVRVIHATRHGIIFTKPAKKDRGEIR